MLLDNIPKKIHNVGFMCRLPEPLLKDARVLAKKYGLSMTEIMKAALRTFIEEIQAKGELTKRKKNE